MAKGTVKWFNTTKGFGFIAPETGGADVFVHISAVEQSGLTGLADDMPIEYDLIEGRDDFATVVSRGTGERIDTLVEGRIADGLLLSQTIEHRALNQLTDGHVSSFIGDNGKMTGSPDREPLSIGDNQIKNYIRGFHPSSQPPAKTLLR